ncbi:MAG: hypothetical protein RDV48_15505 [Candidatus Eremiobacteraeota bacterium]|nr:hypothetical protein [Candidatus Eremiobacteraeota bacterium]
MKKREDGNRRARSIARIKFVVDRLPEGYIYPCTIQDIKEVLMEIPVENTNGIKRIRLSHQKVTNADASYCDGTITIYSIPRDFKFIYHEKPPDSMIREYSRFGARWEVLGEHWYCYWRMEHFRKYILEHVLLHELGHHSDDFHSLRRSYGKEKFAERFALSLENKLKQERAL